MSKPPLLLANESHVKFAKKYGVVSDLGEDLAYLFDMIIKSEGYPSDESPIEAPRKRKILDRAAVRNQKEWFEKQVFRSYKKVLLREHSRRKSLEKRKAKAEEIRKLNKEKFKPLWNFYNDLGAEHAVTIGGTASVVFYKSHEWIRFRYLALIAFGARCCLCGAEAIHGNQIEIDHIKPRYLYPELAFSPDNVQALCNPCHQAKGLSSDNHLSISSIEMGRV